MTDEKPEHADTTVISNANNVSDGIQTEQDVHDDFSVAQNQDTLPDLTTDIEKMPKQDLNLPTPGIGPFENQIKPDQRHVNQEETRRTDYSDPHERDVVLDGNLTSDIELEKMFREASIGKKREKDV